MSRKIAAIAMFTVGGATFLPLLFGFLAMLASPADFTLGANWILLGLNVLCGIGGALMVGAFWVLRGSTRQDS